MKVLAIVILVLGYAAARGSGPYLPSGWKPDGPAFFLPSEAKPADNPLKDLILQGSEASGSDALREYGPPKVVEVTQELVQQALPDVVTEKQFEVINVNLDASSAVVNAEEASPIVEAMTEAQEDLSTVAEAAVPIVVLELTTESDAALVNEEATAFEAVSEISQDSDSSANSISESQEFVETEEVVPSTESIAVEDKVDGSEQILEQVQNVEQIQEEVQKVEEVLVQEIQQIDQQVVKVESVAQNIPDALAYLENGIKQVELAQAQVDAAILENSGSLLQAPEGFLEYGPPGFREYGPPKNELAQVSSEGLSIGEAFESTNEARRRRFSPKFRSTKHH